MIFASSKSPIVWRADMQIYMVGGAVRDALLGLPVKDRDWVVVGATPETLIAQGFLPVGKDFPVFLHPKTKEQYALARTERKTAPGYHGFTILAAPDVTLEQDLARRDLTINAMAVSADYLKADDTFDTTLWQTPGVLVDPFGGRQNLADKVLRHVTPAFREDPVRILRLARFAARFTDFSVAPQTLALMLEMVQHGEVDHLVAERVWQELARGLMEAQPSRMFTVLRDCGALARLLPEVDRLWGVPQRLELGSDSNLSTGVHVMRVLDMAARLGAGLAVRFACLTHDLDKEKLESDPHFSLKGVCERLRLPTECRELADLVAREHGNLHRSGELDAAALVRLLERCDAFRKPQRFGEALLACECDARGRLGLTETPYAPGPRLLAALFAAQSVATHLIAEQGISTGASGKNIGELIRLARVEAVHASL